MIINLWESIQVIILQTSRTNGSHEVDTNFSIILPQLCEKQIKNLLYYGIEAIDTSHGKTLDKKTLDKVVAFMRHKHHTWSVATHEEHLAFNHYFIIEFCDYDGPSLFGTFVADFDKGKFFMPFVTPFENDLRQKYHRLSLLPSYT